MERIGLKDLMSAKSAYAHVTCNLHPTQTVIVAINLGRKRKMDGLAQAVRIGLDRYQQLGFPRGLIRRWKRGSGGVY